MELKDRKTKADPNRKDVSTKLNQVAELARCKRSEALLTLAHHIDVDFLREAHRRTRKDGAVGVDGQKADEYKVELERNLQNLLDRFKSGTYRAPPVRRVHIPKESGEGSRPIGIPTFEDKILQRAVGMVLEAVYEQDFEDCSYGFRPERSAHDAIERLWKVLEDVRGGWVLEVDLRSFFDTIDHGVLRDILDQRVRDGVLRRAIDKWLKAGVIEAGALVRSEIGTPQGGVISPLLANIYLHTVVDAWFMREVRPRMKWRAELIRYADDFVFVFEDEADALRVAEVLPKRLTKFGLTLHPEKTKLIRFEKPPARGKPKRDERPSFTFLGFTHFWGRSRKGWWTVQRKTSCKRLTRALRRVTEYCKTHRHLNLAQQHIELCRKLLGHYAYFGITGNGRALGSFYERVKYLWLTWLRRRSQRSTMRASQFDQLLERCPLPRPRIVHSALPRTASP